MTSYQYENLLPERFQQFCQALLLLSYPDLASFPVGQRDGGRDALSPSSSTVFQVKFKRLTEEESADWVIQSLKGELPKVAALVDRGAKNYVLATNARGTGHLDGGRIDRVQTWLDENYPIPSRVFWRDDLDRRMDSAPDSIRWQFASILTAQDGIRLAVSAAMGADMQRQSQALDAFVATQFRRDTELKFKQVSLSNDLLDLFVDVPVDLEHRPHETPKQMQDDVNALRPLLANEVERPSRFVSAMRTTGRWRHGMFGDVGAARLLLSEVGQARYRFLVLQGAPGQGKSTLAQFVCQVHRARYLERTEFLGRLEPSYLDSAFRLPVKVDLRDFAKYVRRIDPFSETEEAIGAEHPVSIEGFIAFLISSQSGGISFSTDDLASVSRRVPLLFFLDGLDEVANPDDRKRLVELVGQGAARLQDTGCDLQVVVTSRPALFGASPKFSNAAFRQLSLADISITNIEAYTERWMSSRGLDEAQQNDTRRILESKLGLPHIAELTRNPMQLTILLTLIHSVGYSLPDERTDLYGRYLELFLIRESEKSPTVLKHRKALISIVQYLAWTLQSQAETSHSSGSIGKEALEELVRTYLTRSGRSLDIAEELFSQGLERIFILVQRIDGFYEFEVQPLREYFCARYLYETAPVGTYRRAAKLGDRAQRLEAMARNPFWTNVTRFYAGSYETGEIAAIVLSLQELAQDKSLARAMQARLVGAALLNDWVFREKAFAQDAVVEVTFDDIGMLLAASGLMSNQQSRTIELPADCGQGKLREILMARVTSNPEAVDAGADEVLAANGGEETGSRYAEVVRAVGGRPRTIRFSRMLRSGAIHGITDEDLVDLSFGDDPDATELTIRIDHLCFEEPTRVEGCEPLLREATALALAGRLDYAGSSVGALGWGARALCGPTSLLQVLASTQRPTLLDIDGLPSKVDFRLLQLAKSLAAVPSTTFDDPQFDPWESVDYWVDPMEALSEVLGDCWATFRMAVELSATVRGKNRGNGSSELFDDSKSLIYRARYSRYSKSSAWWKRSLGQADTGDRVKFFVTLAVLWCPSQDFDALRTDLELKLAELSPQEYQDVLNTLAVSREDEPSRRTRLTDPLRYRATMSGRLARLCMERASELPPRLSTVQRESGPLVQWHAVKRSEALVDALGAWSSTTLEDNQAILKAIRATVKVAGRYCLHGSQIAQAPMPEFVAHAMLRSPEKYPVWAQELATARVLQQLRAEPLLNIAERESWSFFG